MSKEECCGMLGVAYGDSLSMNDGRIFAIMGEMRLEDCKPCKGMFITRIGLLLQ